MVQSNVTYLLVKPNALRTSIRCKVYLSDRHTKGVQLYLSTGIRRVRTKDWVKRNGKQRLKSTATDSDLLNAKLDEWESKIRLICLQSKDVKEVEPKIKEMFGIVEKKPIEKPRFAADFFRDFIDYKKRIGREKATIKALSTSIGKFVSEFGDLPLIEIGAPQMRSYCSLMKEDGLTDSTVRLYLGMVKQALRWLHSRGNEIDFESLEYEHKERDDISTGTNFLFQRGGLKAYPFGQRANQPSLSKFNGN